MSQTEIRTNINISLWMECMEGKKEGGKETNGLVNDTYFFQEKLLSVQGAQLHL